MSRKRAWLIPLLLLAATLALFEVTDLDLALADLFYSAARHEWLVPKKSVPPRVLLYHGPKVLLIAFGAWLLLSIVLPRSWAVRKYLSRRPARELFYVLLCLGLFPAFISGLKKAPGMHCPSELRRYGGEHAYRKLFSPRPTDSHARGRCFPAGHASGGFALLALAFVAGTDQARKRALALGLGAGSAMGLYQMLNGAHFLSHTLVTMLLAWLFTQTLANFLLANGREGNAPKAIGSLPKEAVMPN